MIPDTTANWTAAERAAFTAKRRSRNIALGLLLGALVVLFYGITVVRMAPGLANGKPQVGTPAAGPAAAKP
jgi:type IV secretory pathway TrbL component